VAESEPTIQDLNQRIIAEFRANGGKVGGQFKGDILLLLTTPGAKTGRRRTNPVASAPDGDRILIAATNGGAPTNPDWYHNLMANPQVTVEIGTETYTATAIPLQGEERDRVWTMVGELLPMFAAYQTKTSRVIPVIALIRHTH
jgi:deazaflavin-dependent oxidoreductase (nitroreductase family)